MFELKLTYASFMKYVRKERSKTICKFILIPNSEITYKIHMGEFEKLSNHYKYEKNLTDFYTI
ncbi:hypothetical protein HZS_7079 [Henneguya salminicola]|nr:hypothetical protein HZS_7079 [Henneguya salminicola]